MCLFYVCLVCEIFISEGFITVTSTAFQAGPPSLAIHNILHISLGVEHVI